ncbi:MAG: Crp/Fnr family transcriptional regulator [Azospirillaceae bacterium]
MSALPPFLDRLADRDRQTLVDRLSVRTYQRNESIIELADGGVDVFFVLEGRAQVIIYSSEGKVVGYRTIGPGDIFGELAAIDGRPRSASVVAQDRSRVGRLGRAAFRELVESANGLAWVMMEHLSTQIRNLTGRIFEYSTLMVRERVVREVLRLAEAGSGLSSGGNQARIHPAPTHSDLAAQISTHREAVSREMSALAKRGLIEKRAGALILHDLAALRALCPED